MSGRVQWRGRADGQPTLVVRSAVILAGALTLAIAAAVLLGQGRFLPAGPAGISGSSPTARLTTPAASVAGPTATLQPSTASGPPPSGPTASPTGSVRALPQTHIVARGETLTSIARHYGVTLAALEKANGLKDPSLIVTGQRLIIPAP